MLYVLYVFTIHIGDAYLFVDRTVRKHTQIKQLLNQHLFTSEQAYVSSIKVNIIFNYITPREYHCV